MTRLPFRVLLAAAGLLLPVSLATAQGIKVKTPSKPSSPAVEVQKPRTPSTTVPDAGDVKDKATDEAVDKAADEVKEAAGTR